MTKVLSFAVFIIYLSLGCALQAQESFYANPSQTLVETGQIIGVTYTLENAEAKKFTNPDFEPFTLISGPSTSTSISIINGQRSMKASWTFQLLAPQKSGTYSIPAAKVITNRNIRLASKPVQIEVVKAAGNAQSQNSSTEKNLSSNKEFFISVEADREEVYPGQLVVLTCKLYSRVDLVSIELISVPEIAESARFKLKQINNNTTEETINGKRYLSKVIQRIAVFPQKPGVIKIDPYVLRVARSSGSGGDSWFPFSRNYDYETVASNPSELVVSSLPMPAPETFSGAVGTYEASMYFDPPLAKAGQSLTATLKIRGVGDLKRFQAPEIDWPQGIEQYDVLTASEEYAELSSGLMGEKKFEYILVPQEAGAYPLPTVFTYFDVESKTYKSVDLSDEILEIKEGTDPAFSQDQASADLNQTPDQFTPPQEDNVFNWKPIVIGGVSILLLLGVALFYFKNRKQRETKADSFKQDALSQLTSAYKSAEKDHFFLELHRILYRWISQETGTPIANVNKKIAEQFLQHHPMPDEDRDQFRNLISKCEQSLYMPGYHSADISQSYEQASNLIEKYL